MDHALLTSAPFSHPPVTLSAIHRGIFHWNGDKHPCLTSISLLLYLPYPTISTTFIPNPSPRTYSLLQSSISALTAPSSGWPFLTAASLPLKPPSPGKQHSAPHWNSLSLRRGLLGMPQIPDLLREALSHPSGKIPWECVSIPGLTSCPGCRAQPGSGNLSISLPCFMVFTWGHCRDARCPEELQGPASPFYSCPGVSMPLSALHRRQPRKLKTVLGERVTPQTNLAVSFKEKTPKPLVVTEIPRNFHLFLRKVNCQGEYERGEKWLA